MMPFSSTVALGRKALSRIGDSVGAFGAVGAFGVVARVDLGREGCATVAVSVESTGAEITGAETTGAEAPDGAMVVA